MENCNYNTSIDGERCKDIKSFLKEIGIAFKFPDYYGQNMDALDECINDLDWIDCNSYTLKIIHFNQFLKYETEETRKYIFDFFDRVKNEWANVPNYSGEEQYRSKANFTIEFIN
jgi:Barstar, RNAse (barnase) inhibitor